jgi:hypothetical protein
MGIARHIWPWLAACSSAFTLFLAPLANAVVIGPAEIFLDRNNVFIPTGIETDFDGNVFVYDGTSAGNEVVHKYSPEGQFLGAIQVHDLFTVATPGGHLARDPISGILFMLLTDGEMRSLDPETGQMISLFDLRALPIDATTVYDVATSRSVPFSAGLLVPPFRWGDFAVLARGNQVDFFISSKAPAHVFILRVRFEQNAFISAKAVVFSRLTTAGNVNLNRGVAVSPAGVVLTTLPILTERGARNIGPLPEPISVDRQCEQSSSGPVNCFKPAPSPFETCLTPNGSACSVIQDSAVAFSADFEPNGFEDPQTVLRSMATCIDLPCAVPVILLDRPETPEFDPVNVPSLGITADVNSNFFIATGPVGSAECGFFASGAMVVIPSTLNFLSCALVTDAPINTSVDVALTPDGQRAYMTLANFGLVVTFAIEP